ncbi:PREDICTED: LOW QUALITY PROTEIN: tudor domain-containing protein 1-like [Wasmannia auropunctata]|uniref:LOW QUALITY PROTEIN: tudor domain-containing protein 1-like n=1 Tax=Wasmannia auropunctata TaxID=64793 RepID=UPI0005ED7DAC|nr:PREDICTED: LOW QUALITY PROTEIN: tudor domain-containing protein 1-like [Wasmannia auropunctata]
MAHFANINAELDHDRMDVEYRIYVNNLPVELNENAIKDIFGQYGEITGMFYLRNGATWCYITYGSYREAELAIRELNNKKPLYLKVTLAKEESSMKEQKSKGVNFEQPKVINAADSLPIQDDIKHENMGHSSHKRVMPQIVVPHSVDHELPSCSHTANVFDVDESYSNTNQLWTRGVITVTPDGKRHVSLGRGYTLYSFPEPCPDIGERISKICEQRNKGLYEYSEDKLKTAVQNCSVCSTKTTKHCDKCRTYYCSRACQLEDWPQHQAECDRIPALIDGISLQINQDVNKIKKTLTPNVETAKSSDVKLRRPNTFNVSQAECSNNTSANINEHKSNTIVTHNSINNTQDRRHVSGQRDNNNVSQSKIADQLVANDTNTKESPQQHRFRRYNNTNGSTDQSRRNNGCSSATSSTDQSYHNRNYKDDSNKTSLKERPGNSNVRDKTFNNDRNYPQRNGFPKENNKGSTSYNDRENTNRQGTGTSNDTSVNDDANFYNTHLSKNKFTTVEVILSLGNNEYWVFKLEDKDARTNLMIKLQDIKNSPSMSPVIGETYGAVYENLWYRAMVTSLNPTKVHFIDFGNDETLKQDAELKDLGDLSNFPILARKIRLTPGTSDKYRNLQEEDKISVKMLSVDSENTIIVEIKEEQSAAKDTTSHATESASNNAAKKFVSQENSKALSSKSTNISTVQVPPSVLDALADLLKQNAASELQINGFIEFCETSQKNVYYTSLNPQVYNDECVQIYEVMQEECENIKTSADYKPKAGDLVCGKINGTWYRIYISPSPETSSKLSFIAIDDARNVLVDQVLPCPEKFLNIYAFGVICEVNRSTELLQVGQVYDFRAIMDEKSHKQESLKIEIIVTPENNSNLLKPEIIPAVVKSWKSSSNILILSELKNGSKVCLTSYRNHYHMFVRSLEEDAIEHYNKIMQAVAHCAQTAPYFTEPPNETQIIIAPYTDGNSYRAMVHKIMPNNKARVIYVDFGNICEIDIKTLKVLPLGYLPKEDHSCVAKVYLKDVPRDIPTNQDVDMYLRNLTGNEVPLVCTFEGSSKDKEVRLTTLAGECVNDKINELLIPGWKRPNSDDYTCYMMKDIEVASLGRVNDTVQALVLFKVRGDQFTLAPLDVQLVTHVSEVMPAMLKEYCETTEYYIPRTNELCLALFEEAWYRATCLNPKESNTTSTILFIDYGNIESVKHQNIRLMPKDFIEPAALANMCTIVNLGPVKNGQYSEAIRKKLDELTSNSIIQIKIVKCHEDGVYEVELPDVRTALIKHGLMSL